MNSCKTIMIMKLRIVLILFVSCCSISFAQNNQIDSKGRKQGEWVKFYPNSKVPVYVGQFIDDKPTGKFTYYYPSNKVKMIVKHNHIDASSEAFMYYENKNILAHGIYRNQEKDSVWTHYAENGRLSFKETYKKGTLHGKKTIFYVPYDPNDKSLVILSEKTFENGVANGPTKEFFPDGVLKMEGNYVDGAFDGIVKRYHPSGSLHILERWKNRKRHGWWITYGEGGKELGRVYYYMGEPLEGEDLKKHMQKMKELGINPNN